MQLAFNFVFMDNLYALERLEAPEAARVAFEGVRSVVQVGAIGADENAVDVSVEDVGLLGVIVAALDPFFFFLGHDGGSFRS